MRWLPVIGVLVFVCLGAGGMYWYLTLPPTALDEGEGWGVVRGKIEVDGGVVSAVATDTETELRREGAAMLVAPGSRVELDPPIPRVLAGRVGWATTEPVVYDGLEVEAGTTLTITPEGLTISSGFVRLGGQVLPLGSTLVRADGGFRRAIPSDVAPSTADSDVSNAPGSSPSRSVAPEKTGRVIDAATGRGLTGVAIRVVYSHSDDGYPAAPFPENRRTITSGPNGAFTVPTVRPEDPRLRAHLQIEHPGRAPFVRVLAPQDANGRWPATTIALRPARTVEYRFFDLAQQPIAGEAVEVHEYDDPYLAADERTVEDRSAVDARRSLDSRTRRVYYYTDESGVVRLTREWHAAELTHPYFTPIDDEQSTPSWLTRARAELHRNAPHDRPVYRVYEPTEVHDRYRMTDRNGIAMDRIWVDVHIPEESRFFRVYTDEDGWLAFGVDERRIDQPPVRSVPKAFEVVTRSPRLWKRKFALAIPAPDEHYAADVREAAHLTFRTVRIDADGKTIAIPPEQLAIDLNMTQVLRGADGEVAYRGPLPDGRERLWIHVRGFVPQEVSLPLNLRGKAKIDLGEIVFEPGKTIELRVDGLPSGAYSQVVLTVDSPVLRDVAFEYRLDERASVRLRGLEDGLRYRVKLSGVKIPRIVEELWVHDKTIADGFTLEMRKQLSVDRDLFVHGRVPTIDRDDTNDYRVIERFYYGNANDPVIHASYPLGPDARFGTWRVVPQPKQVEVLVLGRGLGFARLEPRTLTHGAGEVDAGNLFLDQSRHGVFTFFVPGAGVTVPPGGLRLVAEIDRNHEVAEMVPADDGYRLLIKHLLPGRYTLTWEEPDGERGSHTFLVDNGSIGFREIVERNPGDEVNIVVRVEDPKGEPVVGAVVDSRVAAQVEDLYRIRGSGGAIRGAELGGGVYEVWRRVGAPFIVRALPRAETRLLSLSLFVPRDVELDAPLSLQSFGAAEAKLLDANGQLFAGNLEVSWGHEPWSGAADAADLESGDRIQALVGDPVVASVKGGRLDVGRLPLGLRTMQFRDSNSEAAAVREVQLAGGRADLGVIHLEERRALTGEVYHTNGAPAEGATVSLVDPQTAFHYPLRPRSKDGRRFNAVVDPDGRFRIDGLPLDFREDLALVVRLPGYTDAVEYPVDLEAPAHVFELLPGAQLSVFPGYTQQPGPLGFEFTLEYLPDDPEQPILELGSFTGGERSITPDIRPGLYRLTWNHTDPLSTFEPRVVETYVAPGERRVLSLVVDVGAIEGSAFFNGEALEKGWVIFTDDPSDPQRFTMGVVRDGRYTGAVPLGGRRLFATLVPDVTPTPVVDFATGQGIPIELDARSVARGRASIRYEAYDVTVIVPADSDDAITIETEAHEWQGNRWDRVEGEPFVVSGDRHRFSLVRPGAFAFKVRSTGVGGWTSSRQLIVEDDAEIWIRR